MTRYEVHTKSGHIVEADDEDEAEDVFMDEGGELSYDYVSHVSLADGEEEA
jgi:hypothetical protein